MHEPKLLLINNITNIVSKLCYGSIYVSYESEEAYNYMEWVILLQNTIYDIGIMEQTPAIENYVEDGIDKERLLPGVFRLTWKSNHESPIDLNDDELTLEESCKKAQREKNIIEVSYRFSQLDKLCKKIASNYEIKFKASALGKVFDGRDKPISVYKRLENAYKNGDDKIEFSESEIATQTVRVYCSQLNAFTGNNFKVSAYSGVITVYFKKSDIHTVHRKKIDSLYNSIALSVGKDIAFKLFMEQLGINEPDEEPEWKKSGYESEEAYEDYWRIDTPEPKIETEEDDDF